MNGYYISCDNQHTLFFDLITDRLQEIKSDLNFSLFFKQIKGRKYAEIVCEKESLFNIKIVLKTILREIILVNYKHLFFKNSLDIKISDKALESLFFTSITLYDRDYDSDILNLERVTDNQLSVDGILRFCIGDLLLRWQNVADILKDNFYNDNDREAIYEFVKHIIYSIPCKINELNIYRSGKGYKFLDKEGRFLADFISYNGGELASKIMFINPALINFCDSCDRQTMIFLKNIFNDRIKFY